MILKIALFILVAFIVYLVFFKSRRPKQHTPPDVSDTMVECAQCSVFVSTKEAIIKEGRFYCSKTCAYDAKKE